ncbi:MAG: ParB/RepB/Spo0J family plasmid partition protein [Enterobacterales bacterium endosymbiont of Blomia tropicalis]|uniref:ParB/RepB/Spo0J family plasmid partition protein n=1 Tax=Mixta mediterraneensis TaxID=2758443 RepID=UPI0025A8A530|nr:ParB/RepB/Spo0J family plasmid partition protein [Mixta mediterraneensis]MDL4915973.1 ParB/RepB/Spo0J family plasmid partition protein [Mixta mediterraneensis]
MKRAPLIPKASRAATETSPSAPAAPMVDSLIARVGTLTKGNTVVLPVCSRDVKFVLETVPADTVESATHVWAGNERVQAFLTRDALDDLIPSFLTVGQQTPAFGRRVKDHIEVADGSRRRMTAILTSSNYRVLVGDLDDEQMDALCKLGNDYRPTSAYERGRRYAIRLQNEFGNNISALADAENISRKVITRCINTSKLPGEVIALFPHPGELSARAGEQLNRLFAEHQTLLTEKVHELAARRKGGNLLEADEIITGLMEAVKQKPDPSRQKVVKRDFGPGMTAQYSGNRVVYNLDLTKVPHELVQQLEEIMEKSHTKH